MSPVRALLFDYGGTLDGDAAHWFDHFLELYGRLGVPLTAPALKPAFYAADDTMTRDPEVRGFGLDRMIEAHVRVQLAALDLPDPVLEQRLVDAFVGDTRAAWDRNRPMLRRLAQRFRLGVVSNSYGNLPALLGEAALAPFDVIVDSELVGLRKPDAAIYELAARRLTLPPAAIVHTGDSWERDVVPARNVGMGVVWLARADAASPPDAGDVPRIASLLELEAVLA